MKVIKQGYTYELENFENPGHPGQKLQFIEKTVLPESATPEAASELVTISDGTTNEEVLKMLIDRLNYLQEEKMPCRENAITKLEECLMWLEKRTADRIKRGVEGKHVP